MSEHRYRYLNTATVQGVLVLTLSPSKLEGDEMAQSVLTDLLDAAAHAEANKVVVNLEHVDYLTSANVRPFLGLQKQLKGTGGRMVLCSLSEFVQDTFQVMRLIARPGGAPAIFEVQPDVDAAVSCLADQNALS